MKKMLRLTTIALISVSANASSFLQGNSDNLAGEFLQGSALSFETSINKKLVIECNGAYGVVGISDDNYVAYNRITPGMTISSKKCYETIKEIHAGSTLTFRYEKQINNCNYFGCSYKMSIQLD